VIAKSGRLNALEALGGNVPETIPSLVEFAAAPRDPGALWWVRPTGDDPGERYRLGQVPRTTAEVNRLADADASTSPPCVVQRFLEPKLSGTTYFADGWQLTAAILGPCRTILREGATGAHFARCGEEGWQSVPASFSSSDCEGVSCAERTMSDFGKNLLVEWIITPDQTVHHVDYKEIPGTLMPPPFPRPETFVVGGPPDSRPVKRVERTQIEHLSPAGEPQYLHCESGSPLAHLCVEVAMRNGLVLVESKRRTPEET
jgi:hypothetical protein